MSRPETLADAQRIVRVSMDPREPANQAHLFAQRVREAPEWWEGKGEAFDSFTRKVTNNMGPWVHSMHAISGVGRVDRTGLYIPGPWCGVGASTIIVLAAGGDARFTPFPVHRGAKKLARNCGQSGSFIVKPQGWYKRGSFKGEVDPYLMQWAILIAWHRGVNPEVTWPGHVEIIVSYDPETDTLVTWAPNVAPKLAQRIEMMNRLGIDLVPKQAVWHLRVHPNGSWRRRLYCISAL